MEKIVSKVVQKQNYTLSDDAIKKIVREYIEDIRNEGYDFSKCKKETFTKGKKRRDIYTFRPKSLEDIMTRYLKIRIDKLFTIRYISRNKIMNSLFNTVPVLNDLNDFVIIRADFKSFFESVPTKYAYEKYIQESALKRYEKRAFRKYAEQIRYCYAGLCLSNGLTEIICKDFDKNLRAKLDKYGVVYFERYVDDMLIILNSYISKDNAVAIINSAIKDVFEESPVRLHPHKFSYIARRNISSSSTQDFDFLGYKFSLMLNNRRKKECIDFKYGISELKIKKYHNRFKQVFIEYKKNQDIELLRQRLKICSTRVIITKQIGREEFKWMTKGVVANYNELRFHLNSLDNDTEHFFKEAYFDIMRELRIKVPYFLVNSNKEPSIYNIHSSLERNRSTIFENGIGIKKNDLLKWITKVNPIYTDGNKNYSTMVVDYFVIINIR
ncbi:reverse transcriptase domain-containing protein [Clostridium diolis]|uniref:reverse transcriptase domain-containing protein n=1 Tax=Clostridium diolis TaxID=223919 RepID=UPI003AF88DA3